MSQEIDSLCQEFLQSVREVGFEIEKEIDRKDVDPIDARTSLPKSPPPDPPIDTSTPSTNISRICSENAELKSVLTTVLEAFPDAIPDGVTLPGATPPQLFEPDDPPPPHDHIYDEIGPCSPEEIVDAMKTIERMCTSEVVDEGDDVTPLRVLNMVYRAIQYIVHVTEDEKAAREAAMAAVDEVSARAERAASLALSQRDQLAATEARLATLRRHVDVSESRARAAEEREGDAVAGRARLERAAQTHASQLRERDARERALQDEITQLQTDLADQQEATKSARDLASRLEKSAGIPLPSSLNELQEHFAALEAALQTETPEQGSPKKPRIENES